jgi:ABC-type polysaccharide/polyol phosphate transport system ATPase subunit
MIQTDATEIHALDDGIGRSIPVSRGVATVCATVATVSAEQRLQSRTARTQEPPAVFVRGVSKTFRIPRLQTHTLKERALHPFRFREVDELHAVRDVSFDIPKGEMFGIVGRNGSGKSTLLKCLAGIYRVDETAGGGELEVRGRLSPFIELGVGFNYDLTAYDNVIINAIMLGLTRKEARARFDEIIAFAELEEFLDLKLKNYSSGMYVRLAFSVAVQVDADVVLIDEVLAVGDSAFQQKCFDQFHRLRDEGKTIVFVTHDMGSVSRYCDRAMLLERGRVVSLGEPDRVAREYHELNFGRLPDAGSHVEERRFGDRRAEIVDAWLEDGRGERTGAVAQREPFSLCMEIAFREDLQDPIFGFRLTNELRHIVAASRTDWEHGPSGQFRAGQRTRVRMRLTNLLAPGRYIFTPGVVHSGLGTNNLDIREDYTSFIVHGTNITGAQADLPYELDIESV